MEGLPSKLVVNWSVAQYSSDKASLYTGVPWCFSGGCRSTIAGSWSPIRGNKWPNPLSAYLVAVCLTAQRVENRHSCHICFKHGWREISSHSCQRWFKSAMKFLPQPDVEDIQSSMVLMAIILEEFSWTSNISGPAKSQGQELSSSAAWYFLLAVLIVKILSAGNYFVNFEVF